ncbi:hypothetical protein BUALT_Bualt01G0112500 [Buddleja alternifolia]|uniref:Uncharacterized protein n=1 Tax=Buddleja alternifolia TaxID=168488 RepID=A0AAV6YC70_9LAMI|nr:hypothetical protein BUALT_Bualt01G0112500 [Buddleja alternifolia]
MDAIVNRSNCLEGVQKSLLIEDFESADSYIQTFLQIDAKFKDSSADDQREQLISYKKQLEGIAKKRLSAALEIDDFVDDYFKKDTYLRVYNHMVNPMPGMHDFEESSLRVIDPPNVKVRMHRKKNEEVKGWDRRDPTIVSRRESKANGWSSTKCT